MKTISIPAIGAAWPEQGGIYAGIMRGQDGQGDYHLIVAPADQGNIAAIAWGNRRVDVVKATSYHDGHANTEAMAAAGLTLATRIRELSIDQHSDWYLPAQAEAHLLAANLKDQFEPAAYWTSTQYSAGTAWCQHFRYGHQDFDGKGYEARARAVRRFPL